MTSEIVEAKEYIAKAEKCLKTTFFKRHPDYDSAIEYYTKAAGILRKHQLNDSAEVYKKVAEMYFKIGSYFNCAKNYETASQIYFKLKNYDLMCDLVVHAGRLLRENGTPDSASYIYERAARSLADIRPKEASQFYEKSADACEVEDKFHQASTACEEAAQLLVREREFREAERVLRRFIDFTIRGNPDTMSSQISGVSDPSAVPHLCARPVIVLILIKLHQGDEVAARKVYSEAIEQWRFGEADDSQPVAHLLSAIDQQDGVMATEALRRPCFRNLTADFARIVKGIKLPPVEVAKQVSQPSSIFSPPTSYLSAGEPASSYSENQELGICQQGSVPTVDGLGEELSSVTLSGPGTSNRLPDASVGKQAREEAKQVDEDEEDIC